MRRREEVGKSGGREGGEGDRENRWRHVSKLGNKVRYLFSHTCWVGQPDIYNASVNSHMYNNNESFILIILHIDYRQDRGRGEK